MIALKTLQNQKIFFYLYESSLVTNKRYITIFTIILENHKVSSKTWNFLRNLEKFMSTLVENRDANISIHLRHW